LTYRQELDALAAVRHQATALPSGTVANINGRYVAGV